MRPLVALSLFLVAAPAASAQLCYHPRPKPACSAFVITDFGAFALLGPDDWGQAPWREIADWGVLVNLGERNAIGGSVLATVDRAGLLVGPEVRYRRWLAGPSSFEVGVGLPLVTSTGNIESGSVTGLVRWSPNGWISIAARPEVLRWTTVTSCNPSGCVTASRGHGRVSLGLEFSQVPGAVLTGVSAAATLILYSLVASID